MRNKCYHKSSLGFTLIEVLVALVIFAVLSALSYRSLSTLLQTRERVEIDTAHWREVMIFFNRLDDDFRQHVDRSVKIGKEIQAPWLAKAEFHDVNDAQVIFTRLGSPEQAGWMMDTRRVGYRYKQGSVEVLIWSTLDVSNLNKPAVYQVLTGVKSFNLRYMQHKTHVWVSNWPIVGDNTSAFPKAVEVVVVLNSGERLNRIYNL